MKAILLILVVATAMIIGLRFIKGNAAISTKLVRFTFIGYTNTGGLDEALFSIHLPPNHVGSGFSFPDVIHKEGSVWKHDKNSLSPTNKMRVLSRRAFYGGTQPDTASAGGALPNLFAVIALETTNVPSRIIIKVDEHPRQESQLATTARIWGEKLGFDTSRPGGLSYFITNETGTTTIQPEH